MKKIIQFAVKETMDPMKVIMDCLFENKYEVVISNKILDQIKRTHSYTMVPHGEYDVYTFHKRARGTDTLFSFLITTGPDMNTVFELQCLTELGVMENLNNDLEHMQKEKLCVIFQGE